MHIDPDVGVGDPQGAVEAGHQQGQEGQAGGANELSVDHKGGAGSQVQLLQLGQRGRVSEEGHALECRGHCY